MITDIQFQNLRRFDHVLTAHDWCVVIETEQFPGDEWVTVQGIGRDVPFKVWRKDLFDVRKAQQDMSEEDSKKFSGHLSLASTHLTALMDLVYNSGHNSVHVDFQYGSRTFTLMLQEHLPETPIEAHPRFPDP